MVCGPRAWSADVVADAASKGLDSSVIHALGLELTVMQSFAALTAFNLASIVPSPGNLGSFEAGGTLALTAFGIPKETALAFIFLYHLTQMLPGFVGGM